MRYASGMSPRRLPAGDAELIQIVSAALADAARRSGEWLVCRPGCTQCCVGVFAIHQLDAVRLQDGLAELERKDAQRASRIHARARDSACGSDDRLLLAREGRWHPERVHVGFDRETRRGGWRRRFRGT